VPLRRGALFAVAWSDEMDSSHDLNGIDVPKSLLASKKEEPIMQNDTLIAVDLAKSVFEVAVSERPGKITQRCRLPRRQFVSFFSNRPAAVVLMEACGSAHHWGRQITALGHRVVLLPPHHVRPYVRGNKTDRTDAKGMLEAYRNEDIHPVPVKSVEQQILATLHRLRSSWLAERTAKINTLRGLLRELGVVIPVGATNVVPQTWALIEDAESCLPDALRAPLAEACEEIRTLEKRIEQIETQLAALAEQMPEVARLRSIPGVGLLIATAIVAFVGDIQRFASARHFASYLGLTPRERSSGSTRRLGRISKRGDVYLRMLLIHGARSTLCHAKRDKHPNRLRTWALRLEKAAGHNKAAVALANKMARIIWATWKYDRNFQSAHAA
jgi:transposase